MPMDDIREIVMAVVQEFMPQKNELDEGAEEAGGAGGAGWGVDGAGGRGGAERGGAGGVAEARGREIGFGV